MRDDVSSSHRTWSIGLLLLAGCGVPRAGDPSLGSESEAQQVCPAGAVVKGVDVSVYQGNIDWPTAKATGLDFAIARISDGTFLDTKFAQNWSGMQTAGLVRGAYQFFEPGEDPTTQANIVIQKVGMLGAGDLPVTADMEVTGGQSAATIAAHLQTWISAVKAGTGKDPMIYTAPGFWNGSVGSNAFGASPLWAANWGVNCPNLATGWSNWVFWQYSDMGSINGIPATVDLDEFNGDLSMLKAFAGTNPAYAAKYVTQSFPLATTALVMVPGQSVPAYLEMKNTGTATWDANTRLATSDPRDRMSVFASPNWISPSRLAAVSGMIAPGQSFRFQFDLLAPAMTGTYFEFFNLVEDGVAWFSDPGQGGPPDNQIEVQIQVVQADWAAQLVAQSFPTAAPQPITVGESVDGWFDLKNTGVQTWKAGVIKLAPTPRDMPSMLADASWLSPTRVSSVATDVPPGAVGRFAVRLHGGAVGAVSQTFNLVEEGVHWFSDPPPAAGGPADDVIQVKALIAAAQAANDLGSRPVDAGVHEDGGDGGQGGLNVHSGCACSTGTRAPSGAPGTIVAALIVIALLRRRRGADNR